MSSWFDSQIKNNASLARRNQCLLALAACFFVICSPLFVTAQNSCGDAFGSRGSGSVSIQSPAQSPAAAPAGRFKVSPSLQSLIEQIDKRNRKLPDAALIAQFLVEARSFLQQTGVDYIEDSGVFVILPTRKTSLNRDALRVKEAYDVDVVFHPERLVEAQNGGFIWRGPNKQGKIVQTLGLGATTFFHQKRFLRDKRILHELRHIRLRLNLLSKKPLPFYGHVFAKTGRIPDRINSNIVGYDKYMSFEELRTYQDSLFAELLELSQMVKNSETDEAIKEQLDWTFTRAADLFVMANRTVQLVPSLEKLLAKGSLQPVFSEEAGVIWGTLPSVKIDENVLEFTLPLVSSQSTSDPWNGFYFDQQLKWLVQTARLIEGHSFKYAQMLEAIKGANTSGDAILATIKEIQKTLGQLKQGTPRPKLPIWIRMRLWVREQRQRSPGS